MTACELDEAHLTTHPPTRQAWLAAAVAASSQFLYVMDSGLVALSVPEIHRSFPDAARSTIGWVAGAFLVAQASLLLVGGRLGDRYGRKRFFLAGMATFSLGGLLTALAPTIWLLLAARVVQGAGAAFLTSGALALALPLFPAHKSAVVIGMWGTVGSLGAWLTPTVGAVLVEHNWRWAFAATAPMGVIAVVLGHRVLLEQSPDVRNGPGDRIGYIVGPVALGTAMLVLTRGGSWGWTSTVTLLLGSLSAVGLTVLWQRSSSHSSPLLDPEIFRSKLFVMHVSAGALQQIGFYGWYLTVPIVMRQLWGWSVREIGLALALGQVTASLGSPLGGQFVLRAGYRPPIVVGAVCNTIGISWLIVTMSTTSALWTSYLPMALIFGFGSGMCGTVTTGASLSALPHHLLGTGNSVQQLVRRMGGAIGVAFAVALLGEGSGDALLSGARRAWIMVAIVNALIVVPALFDSRRPGDTAVSGR